MVKYRHGLNLLNETRKRINKECCERFIKQYNKRFVIVEFTYDNKKEKYDVCEGMPVFATRNIKDKNVFNTMQFVIKQINNERFLVNDEWYDKDDFSINFIPAFCVTVYKYEGTDINEHYNIHDVNRMDKRELYTSISHTTKFELNYKYRLLTAACNGLSLFSKNNFLYLQVTLHSCMASTNPKL